MHLLWVATKAPWPRIDGGRWLLWNSLQALARAGCRVTLVAPFDPARMPLEALHGALQPLCIPHLVPLAPRSRGAALLRAVFQPVSVALHDRQPLRAAVQRQLENGIFDAVVFEQLQAFAQATPALKRRLPVLLRCQNVESDLWRDLAGFRAAWAPLFRFEAFRLLRSEARALRQASAVLALTARDVRRLTEISGAHPHLLRAPFPVRLPSTSQPLPGHPAVLLLGGRDWLPNREGADWFCSQIWPVVQRRLPDAVLHVLQGPDLDGDTIFPAKGAVLVVPLRTASGVRIKILEAWSRGVPVVATAVAAAGLEAEDGRELLLAETPDQFAHALQRLAGDQELVSSLVQGGRYLLAQHHDPDQFAQDLQSLVRSLRSGCAPTTDSG